MSADSLYFIALLPPPELRARIEALKKEMQQHYGAGHALKAPAHLTLQIPFKRSEDQEAALTGGLADFAAGETGFSVDLDGFGCFAPRVIFINAGPPEPLAGLFTRLRANLLDALGFAQDEVGRRFHPHITIATRDLRKTDFSAAWAEFQQRPFRASFRAGHLVLLKHNGRAWDSYRAFGFSGGHRDTQPAIEA